LIDSTYEHQSVRVMERPIEPGRRVRYGDGDVPELTRTWPDCGRYNWWSMIVGERWTPTPLTGDPKESWEHLALVDGELLPAGVAMAAELIKRGADWAYDVENWGGTLTLRNKRAVCVAKLWPRWRDESLFDRQGSDDLAEFVEIIEPLLRLHSLVRGFDGVGGVPDVVGARGTTVIMREMKCPPDKLNRNQHAFARVAQAMLGKRLDLAEVVWGETKTTSAV
jgi:hypothetical protein